MSAALSPLDGTSLLHWKSQNEHHRPVSGLLGVVDGLLSRSEMVDLLNNRLLSDSAFRRFRCSLTESGYFKELHSFDAKDIVDVFRIKYRHNRCESVDEDSSSGSSSFELSSDSDTSIHSANDYGIMSPYLSEHIERYHSVPFSDRHKLPLWRMHILQFQSMHKSVLYLKCHHVICDGIYSLSVLLSLCAPMTLTLTLSFSLSLPLPFRHVIGQRVPGIG